MNSRGMKLDEAMELRRDRGQGKSAPSETMQLILRNCNLANEVIVHRISKGTEGIPVSAEDAIAEVAKASGVSFDVVKTAYLSERSNCKEILKALGLEFDSSYD